MLSFQKRKFGFNRRYIVVGGRRLSNYWWSLVIFLGGFGFLLTGVSSYFNRNLLLITPSIPIAKVGTASESAVQQINSTTPLKVRTPMKKLLPLSTTTTAAIGEQATNLYQQDIKRIPSASFASPNVVRFSRGSQAPVDTLENKKNEELEIINGVPNLPFFPQGLVLSFYGFFGLCFSFHLWFTLIWKIGAGFNEFNGKEKYVRVFRWGRPGKNRRIDFKYTKELIETIKIELIPKPALFLCIKGEKNIPLTRIGEFVPLEDLETQAAELTSLLQIPLEIAD